MPEIIQGEWDDLIRRQDLHGRRVRVVVLDDEPSENPWVRSLHAWANRQQPPVRPIDDSREGIYSGTRDDPR